MNPGQKLRRLLGCPLPYRGTGIDINVRSILIILCAYHFTWFPGKIRRQRKHLRTKIHGSIITTPPRVLKLSNEETVNENMPFLHEDIKTRIIPGLQEPMVKEVSCPARFNPREGEWIPVDGVNPHECSPNENFMQLEKQRADHRLR